MATAPTQPVAALATSPEPLPAWVATVVPDRLAGRLPAGTAGYLRYAGVSVISTLVGLGTLAVLVGVGHWPAWWANVVATGLGTVPSFELNRRWVWHRAGQRSLGREVAPFIVLCAVELVASTAAVGATASWTASLGWSGGPRTALDLAANVAAYGLLWVAQYLICDRLLFSGGGTGANPARTAAAGSSATPSAGTAPRTAAPGTAAPGNGAVAHPDGAGPRRPIPGGAVVPPSSGLQETTETCSR